MADVVLERKDYYLGVGTQVLIRKGDLVDPLLKDRDRVVRNLSTISPITLDKVSIDDTGNIIISDPNFRAAVEAVLNAPGAEGTNVVAVCVNGNCASA
jgi:hypothetical protein